MRAQISDNEWLDLALVRRIQFEHEPPIAIITWFDGTTQVYNGKEATIVISEWLAVCAPTDDSLDLKKWLQEKEREITQILRRRGGTMFLIDLLEISDVPYSALRSLQTAGQLSVQGEMAVLRSPF